jgi:chromate transport protein ChrA
VGSFSGICLELGIGIAIGMLAGTTGTHGSARGRMTILAGVIALVLGALLSSGADVSTAVGAFFCLAGAVFACLVVSEVVAGAGRREGSGSGALAFLVSLAALVVVAIAILISPAVLLVLAALVWLGLSRRRKAQRKHAGLRVLR